MRMSRWHQTMGAIIGCIVLVLAVSGILLNHNMHLKLDQRTLNHPFFLALYDIKLPQSKAFAVGDQWLSHWGGNQLYLQDREVGQCRPPFSGAVLWRQQIIAACGDGLLILHTSGELIDRLGESFGLPPVIGVATIGDILFLHTDEGVLRADPEQLKWEFVQQTIAPVIAQPLPVAIETLLNSRIMTAGITVERLIADIHSGRILGKAGIWLADLVALGLIFLAGSGLWMWLRYRLSR